MLSIHKTNQTRNHSYDLSSAQRVGKKKKRKKVWLLEKATLASFHLSFTALMSKSLPLIKVKAGHFSVLRNKATQTKWKQASSEWAQSSVKRLHCSEFSATSRRLSFTLNGVEWTRTHITTVIFKHLSHSSLSLFAPHSSIPCQPPSTPSLKTPLLLHFLFRHRLQWTCRWLNLSGGSETYNSAALWWWWRKGKWRPAN